MKDFVIGGKVTLAFRGLPDDATGSGFAIWRGKKWRITKRYIRMSGNTLEESDTTAPGSWSTCELVEEAQ